MPSMNYVQKKKVEIEQINKEDDFFDDGVYWHTPDDFLKNE